MKSRILADVIQAEFWEKTFTSPLFNHVHYFEFSKLGRFMTGIV